MKIRIFGSKDCRNCEAFMAWLPAIGLPHEFVDAMADDTQSLCDRYNVDVLPHIQILGKHGQVLAEHVGYIKAEKLRRVIAGFNEFDDQT